MTDKKEYILEHVAKLYLRHGIRSVTMDDVAAELGVSKKTLYQYFKDKEDLIDQVVTDFMMKEEEYHEINNRSLNAIDRFFWIREHILRMLKLVQNNLEYDLKKSYPKIHTKIHTFKRKRIYEDNLDIMKQGQREGLFRKEIDSDMIARLTVGRFLFVFNPDHQIYSEDEIRNIKLFDDMLDYHCHGICTEKGLKYFKQQLNNVQNED